MQQYHESVLLDEVRKFLDVTKGKKYIDATLGGGGHTEGILEKGGKVLGIDQDQDAIDFVEGRFKVQSSKFKIGEDLVLIKGNFRNIDTLAKEHTFENVHGILFDLGVSSHQFDTPERGFSFRESGPLDMRMDKEITVTAKDLLHGLTKQELAAIFYRFGEEHHSHRIAQAIVREREARPIETTGALEKIVRHAVGGRHMTRGKTTTTHPATKVFQALRIAINDELYSLEEALPKAYGLLGDRGRLAVITFHSLEDRIVKHTFRDFASRGFGEVLTQRPVIPSDAEIRQNARARSAKLRVFEKQL